MLVVCLVVVGVLGAGPCLFQVVATYVGRLFGVELYR